MKQKVKDTVVTTLEQVKDPEIPSVSIVELGMLEDVEVDQRKITVQLVPTFLGCPALDIIKNNIVKGIGEDVDTDYQIEVTFLKSPPWTSDRISKEAKKKLKKFGIATPEQKITKESIEIACPYCDSLYTEVENIFGPTACRSILYCKHCRNPFEALKPI